MPEKKTIGRRSLLQAAMLSLLTLPCLPRPAIARTAAWPSRPLRLLVGFPAGSSPDLAARLLAGALQEQLGAQPVVVENRPGASGNIAAAALARATDNHTIGLMINGNLTIARQLNPALKFDPASDFAPVALIGSAPLVLVASAAPDGAQNAREFLARARAGGASWNYGSPGVGTVSHLAMELLKSRSGIQALHIPYAGNQQVMLAVLNGEIQFALLPPALALEQQKAGKLALLGVTSAEPGALTGAIPSLQVQGVPDLDFEIWNAVAAPAGMPAQIQARLRAATGEVLASPAIRRQYLQQGWLVGETSATALQQRITADTRALGAVITAQNIRLDG